MARSVYWLAAVPLMLSGPLAIAKDAPTPPSLCAPGETVIFHCGVGRKTVSICGGATADGNATAQYRFGRPGKIELSYPASDAERTQPMTQASIPFSGGGESQIAFQRGGYSYVAFSRVIRTGFDTTNDPAFDAGIFVKVPGKPGVERLCTAPTDAAIDMQEAERFLPEGEPVDH